MNPAAGAVFGLLSSVPQMLETNMQNRRNREFQVEMYERQKRDQLEFWNIQNDYNTPERQMQRFQDAGLNPNLVYSQGNAGNASPIDLPAFQKPDYQYSGFDSAVGAMNQVLDLEYKQAQIDNVRAQKNLTDQDFVMRKADALRSWMNYEMEWDLRDTSMESRKEDLRQKRLKTSTMYDENLRREMYAAIAQQMAEERKLTMQAERTRIGVDTQRINEAINILRKDGDIKDFEIRLNRSGLTRTDELWARLMGLGVQKAGFRIH